jgi:predicted small metal-binding protein
MATKISRRCHSAFAQWERRVPRNPKRGRGERHPKIVMKKTRAAFRPPEGGRNMLRKSIDCRQHPGDINCTVTLSADSEDELMEAAIQHLTAVHHYKVTSEVRESIRKGMMDGTPLK